MQGVPVRYTKKEDEVIIKNYGIRPVVEWLNQLPKRTMDSVHARARRMGLTSKITRTQFQKARAMKPRFIPEPFIAEDYDYEKLWEMAYGFQEASAGLSTRRTEQDVYLDVDYVIGVVFVADGHIGAIDSPLNYFRHRIKLIAQEPRLYTIDCGDKIDNYKPDKYAAGMFGELFPPAMQKRLMENLYSELKGKWLAWVQGCHDEWSHDTDDFDLTEWMASQFGGVNLGHGGLLRLHVGDELYEIAVRHKYRYNSSYNWTHAPKQLVRFDEKTADVAVVAHNHVTAVEYVTLLRAEHGATNRNPRTSPRRLRRGNRRR